MFRSSYWRILLNLCIILAATVIIVTALQPTPSLWPPWGDFKGADLVSHGVAYGFLVILGGILWRRLRWIVLSVLVFSTLLEGLQYFVPMREFFLSDLAANLVGVIVGLAIVAFLRRQQAVPIADDKLL